jgi:hypothetical protein
LSSIQTPQSLVSRSSQKSKYQKLDFFARYKKNSSVARKPDEIFESTKKLTSQTLGQLNHSVKSLDQPYEDNSTQTGSHPHLQAYIERGMGQRLSKKFQFEKEDKNEFLQMICDQMN